MDVQSTTAGPASTDRDIKRRRVLDILDVSGRDSLLLTSQTALSWYLEGSRIHVGWAADPVAAMLVDREGDHLITFSNEAERLRHEEVPDDVAVHEVPWFGSPRDAAARMGSGTSPLEERDVARQLRDARQPLLAGEAERYARLNADAAAALTDVLTGVAPETTEFEVAGRLAGRIVDAGAEPMVLLCNGASRAQYRHPLPTSAPLGRRAMAVVCARRHGMVANMSRWVRFDDGSPRELDAETRIAAVEADIFAATVPGARLNDILRQAAAAYERHGFGPDEWRLHHQGGPAGYAGRDPRATEMTDEEVFLNGAFTWNPSGPGVKIEDTVMLTETGIRVLSVDGRWPVADVGGLSRPITLQL
nr:M24 family metallopeptidase [Arthrobacter castelli]